MLRRLYPLTAYLGDKVSGRRPPSELATLTEELHPAEIGRMSGTDTSQPARQRITATESGSMLEFELSRLDAREAEHGATVRHQLKNVLVGPRGIFKVWHAVYPTGRPKGSDIAIGHIPTYEHGFFSVPPIGLRYFGHWLTDGLTTSYLRRADEALVLPYPPSWHHAADYFRLLGLDPVAEPFAFFRRLTVCTDIGMNANRRSRMRNLSDDIRHRIPRGKYKRVYLSRGTSGIARSLANESKSLPC